MAKEKITVAGGVGESEPFIAPSGAFPENPTLDCHVAGVLVRELPQTVQDKILYAQTDEGLAESDEGKVPAGTAARVTVSPLAKAIQERRDDQLERGMEPWEARDPLKEVADKHVGPGMRPKFLSDFRNRESGTRGFEVVKDGRGDPVRCGTLVLGQMPEERAKKRNEYFRKLSSDAVAQVEKEFRETQDRARREAGA
jgi:hypothetical protein